MKAIENFLHTNFHIELDTLKRLIIPYLSELKAFHFSFLNPLFWLFLILLFLLLARFWENKRAFSFCVILTIVLLATTKTENLLVDIFTRSGSVLDPLLVKIFSLFVILIIFLYYAFVKQP